MLAGVIIALDRQERGQDERSAIQEVEETLGIRVTSIVTLTHLLEYLRSKPGHAEDVKKIEAYREQYGI
jgi:orotate phosphoribosyltransferase